MDLNNGIIASFCHPPVFLGDTSNTVQAGSVCNIGGTYNAKQSRYSDFSPDIFCNQNIGIGSKSYPTPWPVNILAIGK